MVKGVDDYYPTFSLFMTDLVIIIPLTADVNPKVKLCRPKNMT